MSETQGFEILDNLRREAKDLNHRNQCHEGEKKTGKELTLQSVEEEGVVLTDGSR